MCTYNDNGNLVKTVLPVAQFGDISTMVYDKENHLVAEIGLASSVSYTYYGDGLKRSEILSTGVVTTLVWDGSEYLQEQP